MKKSDISFSPEDLDTSIRPQDDFYHFAAGGWLKHNDIPATEPIWGSFYILQDINRQRVKDILEELVVNKNAHHERSLVGDLYRSGMDKDEIEKKGFLPLAPELYRILEITNTAELLKTIAYLHTLQINVLFLPFADRDEKNSSRMAFYLSQGGLGLPERDYYLSVDEKFRVIREEYIKYLSRIFKLTSYKGDHEEAARRVFAIEQKLAEVSMSAEERRDVVKMYNKMNIAHLLKLTPLISWKTYFDDIGLRLPKEVIVAQPKFLKKVNVMLKNNSIEDWKLYLQARLVSSLSQRLSKAFVENHFGFYGKFIFGLQEMQPRWQRIYEDLNGIMGDIIGQEYADRYFSERAKKVIHELVDDLISVYRERIKTRTWMSNVTKKRALKKLATLRRKLGRPNKIRSYANLRILPGEYLRSLLRARKYNFDWQMGKLFRPIDRSEWYMDPHVVNACYWANQNEILFPAGILQPPFFDENGDPAFNYGAIGAVIGHELTHGFDDKGSLYNENGNLKNWWTSKDRKAFMDKAKKLIELYNTYVAVDELHVNGQLTLGENIADLGGVIIAYHGYKQYLDRHPNARKELYGFSPEQRFFIALTLFERAKMRNEIARLSAVSNPHAPAYTRVNGPLANFAQFYDAFEVKEGDNMYLPQGKRAEIW